MKKLIMLFLLGAFAMQLHAQTYDPRTEKFNIGIGMGMEYGGFGVNLLGYPQKNIGIFAGGGYAIGGFGWNAGLKGRFFLNETSSITPFIQAMYGYNAAFKVVGNSNYDKLFYGPTFGAGIDWRLGKAKKNYLSVALTVPVRSSEVEDYRQSLINDGNDMGKLPPVGFSIGYRLRIK